MQGANDGIFGVLLVQEYASAAGIEQQQPLLLATAERGATKSWIKQESQPLLLSTTTATDKTCSCGGQKVPCAAASNNHHTRNLSLVLLSLASCCLLSSPMSFHLKVPSAQTATATRTATTAATITPLLSLLVVGTFEQ